jgi:hypothetical protein
MSRHAYWIAALLLGILVLAKFDSASGFTSLIRFGENWQDKRLPSLQGLPLATVPLSSGYDGQFYAQIALDPLLRDQDLTRALDFPTYRARRILVPTVAACLGLGNPWWTLQAYALVNLLCWCWLGWLLLDEMDRNSWQGFARWSACMFSMGVLESVRQSLVDLPALLLLVLALRRYKASRLGAGCVWLALGNLAKETNLLGSVALAAVGLLRPGDRRKSALCLGGAILPLLLWSFYVHQRLGSGTGGIGLSNFDWPFAGLINQSRQCVQELLKGNLDGRFSFGLMAIVGLLTQSIVLWRTRDYDSGWWRIGAAYSLLLPFLGLWVWSGYWAACRAVLPLTIAFNLRLPANRAFWPLWLAGNLTMLHGVWRFL